MELNKCRKCQFHVTTINDTIICGYKNNNFQEIPIIDNETRTCPLENAIPITKCPICNNKGCSFCKLEIAENKISDMKISFNENVLELSINGNKLKYELTENPCVDILRYINPYIIKS